MAWRRALSDDEIERIKQHASEDSRGYTVGLILGFYDVALSDSGSSYESTEAISPTEYEIPEEQWRQLCQLCTEADGISAAMEFVNVGPSSYAS